jgi:hypothetical protein
MYVDGACAFVGSIPLHRNVQHQSLLPTALK